MTALSDDELLASCRQRPQDSAEWAAACDLLVRRFTPLVRPCARQYRNSPEPAAGLLLELSHVFTPDGRWQALRGQPRLARPVKGLQRLADLPQVVAQEKDRGSAAP